MGYTWRQFTGYREAAARRHAQAQIDALNIALAGGSAKQAARLAAAFTGGGQG